MFRSLKITNSRQRDMIRVKLRLVWAEVRGQGGKSESQIFKKLHNQVLLLGIIKENMYVLFSKSV